MIYLVLSVWYALYWNESPFIKFKYISVYLIIYLLYICLLVGEYFGYLSKKLVIYDKEGVCKWGKILNGNEYGFSPLTYEIYPLEISINFSMPISSPVSGSILNSPLSLKIVEMRVYVLI